MTQEAIAKCMETVSIPTPELAKSWLRGLENHQLPQVVLLRLSFVQSSTDDKFLEEYLFLLLVVKTTGADQQPLFYVRFGSLL